MPSSFSLSFRYELQANGENLNTWGIRLNNALVRIDKSIGGRTAIVLAGVAYTLSTANGADDEARAMILDLSGVGGCNVVIPAVSKVYWARNGSNGVATFTTGAGPVVAIPAGDAQWLVCDGSGVSAQMIGGLTTKAYIDAVRAYVDAQAWSGMAGVLPGQPGHAGAFLKTDGTTPAWTQLQTSDLSDLAAYTAARSAADLLAATDVAVAMAFAF